MQDRLNHRRLVRSASIQRRGWGRIFHITSQAGSGRNYIDAVAHDNPICQSVIGVENVAFGKFGVVRAFLTLSLSRPRRFIGAFCVSHREKTLSVVLIGALRDWSRPGLADGVQTRFTGALAATQQRESHSSFAANWLTASSHQQRGWTPHVTRCGRYVLFSGFIDNHRELAGELNIDIVNDCSLYGAGLTKWGDAIDLKAIGQFSSIVVEPSGESIRIVRSPIAGPPLHFLNTSKYFGVASIAEPFFRAGIIKEEIDQQKVADTLYLNYSEGSRSWFKGVSRVKSGQRIIASSESVTVEDYYSLENLPSVILARDNDYKDAAIDLLVKGVEAAIRPFRSPAISLSGGFDSQAVAAIVARSRPSEKIETFTSVPGGTWPGEFGSASDEFGDERRHVEALAHMYPNLKYQCLTSPGLNFDYRLDEVFRLSSQSPRNVSNLYWIHDSYEHAKSKGCDVMLTGAAGNATFSYDGTSPLTDLAARGCWISVLREARAASMGRSCLRAVASEALLPAVPDWVYLPLLKVLRPSLVIDPFSSWSPLRREYARRMDVKRRGATFGHTSLFRQTLEPSGLIRARMFSRGSEDLGDLDQAFSLIHDLPSRDPTSYRPLVEFCLGIPDDQYFRNGQARYLARRMLRGLVPEMVISEPRRGRQGADWFLRLLHQRQELIVELDLLSKDKGLASVINFRSLRRALVDWAGGPVTDAQAFRLELAIPRAIATSRFIRQRS